MPGMNSLNGSEMALEMSFLHVAKSLRWTFPL